MISLIWVLIAEGKLRDIVRRTRPDLMHANSVRAGLIAVAARALGAPPLIAHVRDVLPPGPMLGVVRAVLGRAAAVICISQHVARELGPGRRPYRRWVVHNGVDLRRFDHSAVDRAQARQELELPEEALALGVVAQITPWKGQEDAITAFAAIRAEFPEACLLMVGEAKFVGPDTRYDNKTYLADLVRQSARLGVTDAVRWLGERRDPERVLAALDVVLVPSWEEPFGRTVIEAMAMERAVIATSVGGPADIIEPGVTGLLLPPRRPAEWSAAMRALLGDPERRQSLGRAARASLPGRFDHATHVQRVLEVYESVLNEDGARDR